MFGRCCDAWFSSLVASCRLRSSVRSLAVRPLRRFRLGGSDLELPLRRARATRRKWPVSAIPAVVGLARQFARLHARVTPLGTSGRRRLLLLRLVLQPAAAEPQSQQRAHELLEDL